MNVPLTPLRFLDRAARCFADKIGVIDGEESWTYGQYGDRCRRLARVLQSLGCRSGDVAAFLSANRHELLEGYYGVPLAGAVLLPLNVRLRAPDLSFILNDSGARWLFCDPAFRELLEQIEPGLKTVEQIIMLGPGGAYERLLGDQAEGQAPDCSQVDENAAAELFYTSGTTARPKGVMLSHRNLYLHALQVALALGVRESDVQLHSIPLFHVNGWGTPQYLTCQGGRHVLMGRFEARTTLQMIERHRVTLCFLVPTMANLLMDSGRLQDYDLSSLRCITLGGAASDPSLIARMEKAFGCQCVASYGLTETSPVLTLADPGTFRVSGEASRLEMQAASGWPIAGVELRIVDREGRDLPWNGTSVGEVIARGDGVMRGYWGREEETFAVLREGWFHTGDLATVSPEGCLRIVDRRKDIIISGGENISSLEVERVLAGHPDILECAVIPVPDAHWGETPLALVVPRSGASLETREVVAHCRRHLPSFKVPRAVRFLDSLPKGGTGKVLKRVLRERYAQEPTGDG